MNINKKNYKYICYAELVYRRINKKLGMEFSREPIENLILKYLEEVNLEDFRKIGKNFYVINIENNVRQQ